MLKKHSLLVPCILAMTFTICSVRAEDETYKFTADSKIQSSVPHGKLTEFTMDDSKTYPGTKRKYSVYVPAQYDASKPAALMVFQDGHAYDNPEGEYRATVVMDNLIAKGEIPVMIGVFVDPGHKKPQLPEQRGWRPQPENRSVEYDSVSGDYAEFLLTEILPKVESEYSISQDPKDRAICGASSGGICAFGVAWHRPDKFGKVISHIGSFVDIRGGHNYAFMVRKAEKKPIRVYLQDGENDLDNQFGNWPLANKTMAASLAFKDYDHQLVMGTGAHNGAHAGVAFPDAMRWLWRE